MLLGFVNYFKEPKHAFQFPLAISLDFNVKYALIGELAMNKTFLMPNQKLLQDLALNILLSCLY